MTFNANAITDSGCSARFGWSNSHTIGTGSPVAIGGIGGSGTRLVAEILQQAGFYLGNNKNQELDNLWFTLLFKRFDILQMTDEEFSQRVEIFGRAMTNNTPFTEAQRALIARLPVNPPPDFSIERLAAEARSLLRMEPQDIKEQTPWGWKEPNTHVIIDRLAVCILQLKYVHVIRNGLDMAFSENQTQLKLWGRHFLAGDSLDITPRNALKFWRVVHERILDIGPRLGIPFRLVNFDELCRRPDTMLGQLSDFLGIDHRASDRARLRGLIRPPASLGRFQRRSLDTLDAGDIQFVANLGFDTRPR